MCDCRYTLKQVAAEQAYWKEQMADYAISVAQQEAIALMAEEEVSRKQRRV